MPAKPTKPNMTTQSPAAYPAAIDAHAEACHRIATAFSPSEADTPNMTVAIAAGALLGGSTLTEVSAQSTGTITAPTTNPRIDRVVIDSATGSASVVAGTPAASPVAPAIPTGKLPVARVLLTVGMAAITNSDITDERVGGGGGVELAQDLLTPGEDTAPSTQAVASAVWSLADQLALTNLRLLLNTAVGTGALANGKQFELASDEWGASSTNETFSSGPPGFYTNAGSISGTPYSLTSGMLSHVGFSSFNAAQLCDGTLTGQNGTYGATGAAGSKAIKMDLGAPVNLGKLVLYMLANGSWKVVYSDDGITYYDASSASDTVEAGTVFTWSSVGSHRYWAVVNTASISSISYTQEVRVYAYTAPVNMTLLPPAPVSLTHSPGHAALYVLWKDESGSANLHTDFSVELSRDGGTTWVSASPEVVGGASGFDGAYSVLLARASFAGAPEGTNLICRIKTLNAKAQRVAAPALYAE